MNRYEQIWNWLQDHKSEVICEIGTWDGKNGARMMKLGGCTKYIGFDIWEDGSEELDKIENNVKARKTLEEARKNLNGYEVELIQGNTRETIKAYAKDKGPFIDMVFIDGGHSKYTITSDFMSIFPLMKDSGTIFMDDYYYGCKEPDVGAQSMLAAVNFPYTVLPAVDKAKDYLVKIVKIAVIDCPRVPKTEMSENIQWKFTP